MSKGFDRRAPRQSSDVHAVLGLITNESHVCTKAVVEGQGVSMLCVLCYACSGLHSHTQVKAMLGAPKGKDASGLSDDETIEKCLNEVEAALNAGLNFKGKFNSGLQVNLPTVHFSFSIYTGGMHVSDHKGCHQKDISPKPMYIAGQKSCCYHYCHFCCYAGATKETQLSAALMPIYWYCMHVTSQVGAPALGSNTYICCDCY